MENLNFSLSRDYLKAVAPSIFAEEARGDRSDKYRFAPTIDVLDALREEGFLPVKVAESRALDANNRPFVKHTLRLRRESDLGFKITQFDQVIPEIALTNSHDGTSGFILDAALHRLVCKNGLIAASSQGTLRFRHTGKDDLAGRVIEGAYEIVKDFPAIADSVTAWSGIQLNDQQRLAFATAALPLRFDQDETTGQYPVDPLRLLTPRRFGDSKKDLFTTFNVVQESLIRGGVRQPALNGRRRTTRQITSVDKDLRLNRSLWTLAAELAKAVQ